MEKEKEYSLRLYDRELLRFTMERRPERLRELAVRITGIDEESRRLLPLDLEPTDDGVLRWLRRRAIPKNRAYVGEILAAMGLSVGDTKGIIDVCLGLSLTDSYWVVPAGFCGKFADYNLFQNPFSEALSIVAYTGAGDPGGLTTSPEFTTNGMLPKAWRRLPDGGIYLYKGGTAGASNTGREPYCEFYAAEVALAMNLRAVEYDLEEWKGIVASKCALFTDIDTSFVPAYGAVRSDNLRDYLEYYDGLGEDFGEQFRDMMVFDAVIWNTDRHAGNFGLLRDNRTGEIVAPAPIFDNGLSLLCYAGRDEVSSPARLLRYAKTRAPAFDFSFEEIVSALAGKRQAEKLERLSGFSFRRHPSLNLPEEHLLALEEALRVRVRDLLGVITSRVYESVSLREDDPAGEER